MPRKDMSVQRQGNHFLATNRIVAAMYVTVDESVTCKGELDTDEQRVRTKVYNS